MTDTTQAFFSYATDDWDAPADSDDVQFLVKNLEVQVKPNLPSGHFKLWRDKDELRWGDDWRDRLQQVIAQSHLFIALVSLARLRSEYCKMEYEAFASRAKDLPGSGRILPILFRDIAESDLEQLALGDRKRYEELKRIQMERWTDLPILDDAGKKETLRRAAGAIKSRIVDLASDAAAGSTNAARTKPSGTRIPIPVDDTPPVTGKYDYGAQGPSCLLSLATTGLAEVETEHGDIVFSLSSFRIQTTVTGGTIEAVNTDFVSGWHGPIARVQQIGIPPFHTLEVVAEEDEMAGFPMVAQGEGEFVRLFDISPTGDEAVEIQGEVKLTWRCIRIHEDEEDGSSEVAQLRVQQKRIIDILMKQHGLGASLQAWTDET